MAGEPLLEARDLKAGYGSGDILQGVTLMVGAGEIVATIGRNGVGKSTLMKSIIGLLAVRSGTIRFQEKSITDLRADQRAALGIGYVPQGRDIFPELTVEENLMMGESINQARLGARYDMVYDYFPVLRERRGQAAGTFSGGQQQMLAIGRALVGRPGLLLLDEPSSRHSAEYSLEDRRKSEKAEPRRRPRDLIRRAEHWTDLSRGPARLCEWTRAASSLP